MDAQTVLFSQRIVAANSEAAEAAATAKRWL
jgi:hypothetical protein